MDTFSQKIADKIADNVPGTILVTIDSKKLSLNIDTHALIVQQHDSNIGEYIILSQMCYYMGRCVTIYIR